MTSYVPKTILPNWVTGGKSLLELLLSVSGTKCLIFFNLHIPIIS